MLRTIEQPADLSGAALSEFKNWLGITRPGEDAILVDLLRASLEMCEAFTGQAPLEQAFEERLAPRRGSYCLATRPVQALTLIEEADATGARAALMAQDYTIEIDAAGVAMVHLARDFDAVYVAAKVVAGIAPDWPSVPKPLRQGIVRLASFYYRDRDREQADQPPASVTALWRPWRILRLA